MDKNIHASFDPSGSEPRIVALLPSDQTLDALLEGIEKEVHERKSARLRATSAGKDYNANIPVFWTVRGSSSLSFLFLPDTHPLRDLQRTIRPLLEAGKVSYYLIKLDSTKHVPLVYEVNGEPVSYGSKKTKFDFEKANTPEREPLPEIRFVRHSKDGELATATNLPNPVIVCFDLITKVSQQFSTAPPPPHLLPSFIKALRIVWAVLEVPTTANLQDEYSPEIEAARRKNRLYATPVKQGTRSSGRSKRAQANALLPSQGAASQLGGGR